MIAAPSSGAGHSGKTREAMSNGQAAIKIDDIPRRESQRLFHAGGLASAGGTERPVALPCQSVFYNERIL